VPVKDVRPLMRRSPCRHRLNDPRRPPRRTDDLDARPHEINAPLR
jgi:hypothetical protein